MRVALALVALLLVACGGHKNSLPPVAPGYPGATDARTTANGSFSSTDWTLASGTRSAKVYDWYAARLGKLGWRITDRNGAGLHAEKGTHTLDIGVRGSTLEVNRA